GAHAADVRHGSGRLLPGHVRGVAGFGGDAGARARSGGGGGAGQLGDDGVPAAADRVPAPGGTAGRHGRPPAAVRGRHRAGHRGGVAGGAGAESGGAAGGEGAARDWGRDGVGHQPAHHHGGGDRGAPWTRSGAGDHVVFHRRDGGHGAGAAVRPILGLALGLLHGGRCGAGGGDPVAAAGTRSTNGARRENGAEAVARLAGGHSTAADAVSGVAVAEPLPRWAGDVPGWLAVAPTDARRGAGAAGDVRPGRAPGVGATGAAAPAEERAVHHRGGRQRHLAHDHDDGGVFRALPGSAWSGFGADRNGRAADGDAGVHDGHDAGGWVAVRQGAFGVVVPCLHGDGGERADAAGARGGESGLHAHVRHH
ncbi:MAG: Uncharacterized MFS-type transporter, partial [uncultured Chloroflexi bacterium]